MRPVYIGGVPRLTHPQELFDLLHLCAEPVILLVQVIVLVLQRLQLGVSLGPVVQGLHLVEGLPALVKVPEA